MDVLWPVGVMQRLLCRCRHEVTGALEFESRARWRKGKESLGRLLMDEPLPIFDQRRKLLGTDHDLALRGRGRFTNRPYGCACPGRGIGIRPGLTRAVSSWAGARALVPLGAVPVLDRCRVRDRGRSWFSGVP